MISWFDDMITDARAENPPGSREPAATPPPDASHERDLPQGENTGRNLEDGQRAAQGEITAGEKVYARYYEQPVERILIPMFFVSISRMTIESLTDIVGINWLCNSYHQDVPGQCSLAWRRLRDPHGFRETDYWIMACSVLR